MSCRYYVGNLNFQAKLAGLSLDTSRLTTLSETVKTLLELMLVVDASKRLTISQVKHSLWISEGRAPGLRYAASGRSRPSRVSAGIMQYFMVEHCSNFCLLRIIMM
jgi:hypothetical protein